MQIYALYETNTVNNLSLFVTVPTIYLKTPETPYTHWECTCACTRATYTRIYKHKQLIHVTHARCKVYTLHDGDCHERSTIINVW
jgi:hypothetical protein